MNEKSKKRQMLWATVFCFFFYFAQSVARNIFGTLHPFLVEHYKLGLAESSLFSVFENIGFIVIMVLVTIIADRIDKAWLTLGICGIYGVILLIMGTAPNFFVFLALLFITGMLGRYADTTCTAYISDLYGEDRTKYMSWLLVAFYVGSTLAPNLNTFILEILGLKWNVSYTVSGVLMCVGVVLYAIFLFTLGKPEIAEVAKASPADENGKKVTIMDLLKNHNMRVLFISNVLASVSFFFGGQLILFLSMSDPDVYNTATRGFIATAGSIGLVVGSAAYLVISRKMSAHRYLAMETLISFLASISGLIINNPVYWMVSKFVSSAIGGGSFTARTLLCCEEFPEKSSSAIAIVSLASGISSIFTTPIFSALAEATSFSLAMYISLFFNLGSWAVLRFAYKAHDKKENE